MPPPLDVRRSPSPFTCPLSHVSALAYSRGQLDEFVWDLAELERAAGLTFFPELPERHSIPPLCGGAIGTDTRCGLGSKLDGMIRSNKAVGQLSLASDCESLEAAWQRLGGNKEVGSGQKFHRRLHDDRAETLACPFKGRSAAGRSSGN